VNIVRQPWALLLTGAFTLSACSDASDAEVVELQPVEGQVDLAAQLPGVWQRVCVLAPYSTDRHAREILGVDADVSLRSRIVYSDSIALLVTVRDGDVSGLFEVPRSDVDFAHLGGECFNRAESGFAVPESGHPYATHAEY